MKLLDRLGLARDTNLILGTLLERLTTIHADRRLVEEEEGEARARWASSSRLRPPLEARTRVATAA